MNGYLYILKHGIGPGTMPSDITILKEKDLPNYYTAVWLDRFLTTSELKQYDIPSETRINELLDRIDYCQIDNGDDVVPCDEVNACDKVTASVWDEDSDIEYIASQVENELNVSYRDDDKWIYLFSDEDAINSPISYAEVNSYYTKLLKNRGYHGFKPVKKSIQQFEDKITKLSSSSNSAEEFKNNYRKYLMSLVDLHDVEACDKVTASKIVASKMSDIDLLANEALECTTKDELGAVISGLDSLGLRKLYLHYMEMLRDDSLSVGYIASDLSDTLYNMFSDEVNACDNVMASDKIHYDTFEYFNMIVGEDLWLCCNLTGWFGYLFGYPYYVRVAKLDQQYAYVNVVPTYNSMNGYSYDIDDFNKFANKQLKYKFDDIEILDPQLLSTGDLISKLGVAQIDACNKINASTKSKYFANMVSADTYFRHPEEWGYEVQGYYDIDRRGLAESDWTEDIRMVNDLLNNYANKGYYLRVTNNYAGIILDIDADDWFDSFYPDGLSEGELE